jgi:hypothetical protein
MFTLTLKTDNAAFCDESANDEDRNDGAACGGELARILSDLAGEVANGGVEDGDRFPLRDSNGNRVGEATYTV